MMAMGVRMAYHKRAQVANQRITACRVLNTNLRENNKGTVVVSTVLTVAGMRRHVALPP